MTRTGLTPSASSAVLSTLSQVLTSPQPLAPLAHRPPFLPFSRPFLLHPPLSSNWLSQFCTRIKRWFSSSLALFSLLASSATTLRPRPHGCTSPLALCLTRRSFPPSSPHLPRSSPPPPERFVKEGATPRSLSRCAPLSATNFLCNVRYLPTSFLCNVRYLPTSFLCHLLCLRALCACPLPSYELYLQCPAPVCLRYLPAIDTGPAPSCPCHSHTARCCYSHSNSTSCVCHSYMVRYFSMA